MKLLAILLLLATAPNPGQEDPQADLQLQDLLTDREFRDYRRKPRYKDRINLFKKAFERNFKALERHVERNELGESAAQLLCIQALCHHVEQESSQVKEPKDLRSKQVKQLEIQLRQLAENIKNLQRAVPWDHPDRGDTQKTLADPSAGRGIECGFIRARPARHKFRRLGVYGGREDTGTSRKAHAEPGSLYG